MKIKEITAKNIITKSNLPDTDFVINPYTGCTHSCIYCYARFMKRFTNHEEEWGDFLDVKINSVDLIPENTDKYKNKKILLSSVTDPYLPLEQKYELTRNILKKLVLLEPSLGILTKSDLVVRDIDILKQFNDCEVGFTINTLNDSLRKEIEPKTVSVENRIKALKKIKDAGLKTYVFVGPLLPHLLDWKEVVKQTKGYVDEFMFENLNISGTVWQSVKKWLQKYDPKLVSEYERIYFTKNNYWGTIEEEIRDFCEKEQVDYHIYFHHNKIKK